MTACRISRFTQRQLNWWPLPTKVNRDSGGHRSAPHPRADRQSDDTIPPKKARAPWSNESARSWLMRWSARLQSRACPRPHGRYRTRWRARPSKRSGRLLSGRRPDCRHQRLLGVGEFGPSFGQRRRDGADRFATALHGSPPPRGDRSLLTLISSAWPGLHGRWLAWIGHQAFEARPLISRAQKMPAVYYGTRWPTLPRNWMRSCRQSVPPRSGAVAAQCRKARGSSRSPAPLQRRLISALATTQFWIRQWPRFG